MSFANVPNLPGVPSIPRSPNVNYAAQAAIGLIGSQIVSTIFPRPFWGVVDATTLKVVAEADTVASIQYKNEARVTTAPTANGSFVAYNKIKTPYSAVVRMVKSENTASLLSGISSALRGTSTQSKFDFLAALEAARDSTNLYDIVTPDATYYDANIISLAYQRSASSGSDLLIVDVFLQEIRTSTPVYSSSSKLPNATNPSAADVTGTGKAQTSNDSSILSNLAKVGADGVSNGEKMLSSAKSYLGF